MKKKHAYWDSCRQDCTDFFPFSFSYNFIFLPFHGREVHSHWHTLYKGIGQNISNIHFEMCRTSTDQYNPAACSNSLSSSGGKKVGNSRAFVGGTQENSALRKVPLCLTCPTCEKAWPLELVSSNGPCWEHTAMSVFKGPFCNDVWSVTDSSFQTVRTNEPQIYEFS